MLFSEIIGQDHLKTRLKETVRNNRVAHAQLFYGSQGSGKLALAIAYAQFINCRDKQKIEHGDSCGKCPSCIKYNKLIHPDLHFVFPVAGSDSGKKYISSMFFREWREFLIENSYYVSLNDWYTKIAIERRQAAINVHESNQIIHTLSYTSYESEYKVMLIWMVEKLNYQAAPKLLKILEEPPDKTLFLLIADQTDQIISTILSRLLPVKVPRIEDAVLIEACHQRFGLTENEAAQIGMQAEGSFTEALRLLGQSETRKLNFERFRDWMRNCWQFDVKELLTFSDLAAKESRDGNKSFLQFGLLMLRNCLMLNYTKDAIVRITNEERSFYEKFSPFINHLNILSFTDEFNKAIYHIERNVHTGLVFFDLSLTSAKLLRLK
ncbi:MAG: DNA polymerase III subunit delta [Bacteroidales bacterium]|nr:DNA polymerase III subunit delta [Bacteroidales bacterium]